MSDGRTYKPGMVGWVACDYTQGDTIQEVEHSDVYDSYAAAWAWNDSWREVYGDDHAYEGIRRVDSDGNLYVDERYLHEDDHLELYYEVCILPSSGGFGEYDCVPINEPAISEKEFYSCIYDQQTDCYELGVDELPEGVEDIRGRIHNEPGRVFALRDTIDLSIAYTGLRRA